MGDVWWVWAAAALRHRQQPDSRLHADPDPDAERLPLILEALRVRTARQAADFDAADDKAAGLLTGTAAVIALAAIVVQVTGAPWPLLTAAPAAVATGLLLAAMHPRDFRGLEPRGIYGLRVLPPLEILEQLIAAELKAFDCNQTIKKRKTNLMAAAQWCIAAALAILFAGTALATFEQGDTSGTRRPGSEAGSTPTEAAS